MNEHTEGGELEGTAGSAPLHSPMGFTSWCSTPQDSSCTVTLQQLSSPYWDSGGGFL